MKFCIITFRSVMPAQKAEYLLKSAGIESKIVRTPRWMEEQGCGYSLQIRYRDLQTAIQILQKNRISFRKAYLKAADGTMEALLI